MNNFEQLLYETRFSIKDTLKRMSIRYSKELNTIMNCIEIEKQKLVKKYSSSNLSNIEVMRCELNEYLEIIIKLINQEYGKLIPKDKLIKLNNMINDNNILIINDSYNLSIDSNNGQVIINVSKIGKTDDNPNPDIYTQIVTAKGTLPYELFHIIIQMLKPEEISYEKMVINLSDGQTLTSRGMVGFILNEGFIEKISKEFCQKYGLHYMINPQYIPYIDICDYFMECNSKINSNTIFSLDEWDCLRCLNEEDRQNYYKAEAISYAVRYHGKSAEEVINSHIEKVSIDLCSIPKERLEELQEAYYLKKCKLTETLGRGQNTMRL